MCLCACAEGLYFVNMLCTSPGGTNNSILVEEAWLRTI